MKEKQESLKLLLEENSKKLKEKNKDSEMKKRIELEENVNSRSKSKKKNVEQQHFKEPVMNGEYPCSQQRDFLEQMISKIINEYYMSEKQKGRIIKIILGDNAPATNKQLRYIESLSGKPTEGMTKENASKMIDELKERKNNAENN